MACSQAAAEWLFGKKRMEGDNFCILPNAINVERFRYHSDLRTSIREEHSASDKLVLGQVGSFDSNKNQLFSVDLLHALRSTNPNAVLWLIGSGSEEGKTKARVQ